MTIVDIAKEIGVSKTLVSNALHGRGRVSEETRTAVLQAAASMGYVSNKAAQQLRADKYGTIGLVIPKDVRSLSFYMQLVLGVSEACAQRKSNLMLYTSVDETSEVTLNAPVDGVIICDPTSRDRTIEQMAQEKIPVVTVGNVDAEQAEKICGTVSIDYQECIGRIFEAAERTGELSSVFLVGASLEQKPIWVQEIREAFSAQAAQRTVQAHLHAVPAAAGTELDGVIDAMIDSAPQLVVVAYQGLASSLRKAWHSRSAAEQTLPLFAALPGDPISDAADPDIISVDLGAGDYGAAAVDLLDVVLGSDKQEVLHRQLLAQFNAH